MLLNIPNEIIYRVFDFLISNMYKENYNVTPSINKDYEKKYIKNYLLVSKDFSNLFITKIIQNLNIYFNIQIIKEKGCKYSFWKKLIYSLIIENFKLDEELFILDERRKKLKKKELIRKIEKEIYYYYQRREFIYDFLSRNYIKEKFTSQYNFYKAGKKIYRKSLKKNYIISKKDIREGNEYKLLKFKEFYNYIIPYYKYTPMKTHKMKFIESIEKRENKRLILQKKLFDGIIIRNREESSIKILAYLKNHLSKK